MNAQRATTSIIYVINSFDRGGAEAGLLRLVKGGLFADCDLRIVALVRGTGGLERQLAAMGHVPEILMDRERMRSLDLPVILASLWRLIRRHKPHVVIGSLPQANLLARLCVAFQRSTTFISFEHNSRLAKAFYEWAYRRTSGRVDWMFADAEATRRATVENLYIQAPRKHSILPLVSFDTPARRSTLTREGTFHIINAARFTPVKNQAALIRALALLTADGRDVKLTLYGEGPELETCRALAEQLGIANRVNFEGFTPDWPARPADLFVLASHHEGLCIVALEAMHAGLPVAAPLIGGLQDYGVTTLSYVLPSVQPADVAIATRAVMDGGPSFGEAVRNAAIMVDHHFGADAVARRYRDINKELIGAAPLQNSIEPETMRTRPAPSKS